MDAITSLYLTHPFWIWLAVAAVFLGAEIATGTGWLLWPTAAAAVVALINLATIRMGLPAELVVFAVLTIVSALTARRYLPHNIAGDNPDINDPLHRLVGRHGVASASFLDGRGRVAVDGKDWAAELDGGRELEAGSRVEVTGVVDGARLSVRAT